MVRLLGSPGSLPGLCGEILLSRPWRSCPSLDSLERFATADKMHAEHVSCRAGAPSLHCSVRPEPRRQEEQGLQQGVPGRKHRSRPAPLTTSLVVFARCPSMCTPAVLKFHGTRMRFCCCSCMARCCLQRASQQPLTWMLQPLTCMLRSRQPHSRLFSAVQLCSAAAA